MYKKYAKLIPLLAIILILSACGQRNLPTDKPLEDGSRFYRNEMLKFSLVLPASFEYYQTQRTEGKGYSDLEIFVPTSDVRQSGKVSGYAQPIVIRVFDKVTWDEVNQDGESEYQLLGEKDGKAFTLLFWKNVPKDWQDKWSAETEKMIIDNFKLE
jgi:hypothetical protein